MSETEEGLLSHLLAQQTLRGARLKQMSPVVECTWPSPCTQFLLDSAPMNCSS